MEDGSARTKAKFLPLAGLSILFGLVYTFCLYKNGFGITIPLLVGLGYLILAAMMRQLRVKVKKDS